jgi:hypothetical protein
MWEPPTAWNHPEFSPEGPRRKSYALALNPLAIVANLRLTQFFGYWQYLQVGGERCRGFWRYA